MAQNIGHRALPHELVICHRGVTILFRLASVNLRLQRLGLSRAAPVSQPNRSNPFPTRLCEDLCSEGREKWIEDLLVGPQGFEPWTNGL
jgi:hypothetical protein